MRNSRFVDADHRGTARSPTTRNASSARWRCFVLAACRLSTLHQRARNATHPRTTARSLALEPASRAWLHARIAQRFDAMLAAGFLDEVRALRANPALNLDLPSMRCVGYRQAWEALDVADPPNVDDLRERGVAATRQLAKRQITWLRSMAHRRVVEADAGDVEARLLAGVEAQIGAPGTSPL